MPYIHYIADLGQNFHQIWLERPETAFGRLSLAGKAKFLLEQNVLLGYLRLLYQQLPPLLQDYWDHCQQHYLRRLRHELDLEEDRPLFVSRVVDLFDGEQGIPPVNYSDEMIDLLLEPIPSGASDADQLMPHAGSMSFYRPFILYYAAANRIDLHVTGQAPSNERIQCTEQVSLPTFILGASGLHADYVTKCPSFKLDFRSLTKFCSAECSVQPTNSALCFWLGYDWRKYKLNELLAFVAAQAIELDLNRIPHDDSDSLMFYDVYRKLTGWLPPVLTQLEPTDLASSLLNCRRRLINWLLELRQRFQLAINDTDFIASLLNGDGGDEEPAAEKLKQYFAAKQPSAISVEMYQAYKQSIFSQIPELDRLQWSEPLDVDTDILRRDNVRDSLIDRYSQFSQEAASRGLTRLATQTAPWLSTFSLEAETPDEAQVDGEDSAPDTEQAASSEPNATEDEPAPMTVPDGSTGETEVDPDTVDDTDSAPPLPNVSSRKGITLELTPGENTDTTLYRLELESYVDSLLANPPKYLSVQKLDYLKKIKAYWFNILSVQALYDVLGTIISVPNTFKPKPPRKDF